MNNKEPSRNSDGQKTTRIKIRVPPRVAKPPSSSSGSSSGEDGSYQEETDLPSAPAVVTVVRRSTRIHINVRKNNNQTICYNTDLIEEIKRKYISYAEMEIEGTMRSVCEEVRQSAYVHPNKNKLKTVCARYFHVTHRLIGCDYTVVTPTTIYFI